MRKLYLQIIDPVKNTSISRTEVYDKDDVNAIMKLLREYGIEEMQLVNSSTITNNCTDIPNMPKYEVISSSVLNTSKIVTIVEIIK